jgi:hypothetical protein
VFYYGRHNHPVPERKPGRGIKRPSPIADAASPQRHVACYEPRVARPVRHRQKHRLPEWDDEGKCPPSSGSDSQDSQRSDHLSDFDDFSRGDVIVNLPAGEGRCPLFFLACVAAKEPSCI